MPIRSAATVAAKVAAPATLLALAALAAMLAPGPVQASEELARTRNCAACHARDRKLLGPSYRAIAAKYASDKTAAARLVTKVRLGGSGVWGPVPMPANPQVSHAEAAALVNWVLSTR